MPHVLIKYDGATIAVDAILKALPFIAHIVADTLCEPGAELAAADVEIQVQSHGLLDYNVLPLGFTVTAKNTTRRQAKKADLAQEIGVRLTHLSSLQGLDIFDCRKAFVWLLLPEAEFRFV